jgi:hypothetical protein
VLIATRSTFACGPSGHAHHPPVGCTLAATTSAAPPHGLAWPTFHGDRGRTGWNSHESTLTPAAIASGSLAVAWESPELDEIVIGGAVYAPHAYASPLYVDDLPIAACRGTALSVLFAATSNGYVYAVNAFNASVNGSSVAAGTLLWRTALAPPTVVPGLDGGVPLGTLSTPVLDAHATPPRLYVTAVDGAVGWRAYALDATTGVRLPGWPVTIDESSTRSVNSNGPSQFKDAHVLSQRGALNLSADGGTLYVPFGAYSDGGVGWMVAVDTASARVVAAHSSAPSTAPTANGGVWSAGGAAIDSDGLVYAMTGNSPDGSGNAPHVWGESLLQWRAPLQLGGTYTPFNYCALDKADVDLGGSSPLVLDLDPAATSTPKVLALGSKQGNVYLVDRTRLPGSLDARPPCRTDPTTDGSLLPPEAQPQFGVRGPLNVFGPYSEAEGNLDYAKMRTTPASFQAGGIAYVFVSGASKAQADSTTSVPPCVARLRVVAAQGAPAYLAVDQTDKTLAFRNPGSPVVTSDGEQNPVVWVLDENASRTASLVDSATPHPILYAIDGTTLAELWNSAHALHLGGKYATPVIAHGTVFVVTDRVQAFAFPQR